MSQFISCTIAIISLVLSFFLPLVVIPVIIIALLVHATFIHPRISDAKGAHWFAFISCCILCFIVSITTIMGYRHGMYRLSDTIPRICESIQHSPDISEQDVPPIDELNGSIVILYKFGCKDCESVYFQIQNELKEHSDKEIYWLSSRSKQGQEFLKRYPVDFVPTGIYVYNDQNSMVTYTQKPLAITGTDDNVVFNDTGWNRLLEIQNKDSNSVHD